ncbi:MAG: HlyD family secretion protein [Pseudomonadota bacterium]
MAEPNLKIVPEGKAGDAPDTTKPAEQASEGKKPAGRLSRGKLRSILLIGIPTLAVVIGLGVYLSGGRYISTDNAYIGAQKVLITPDISGKVGRVTVREGQHVNAGDELFAIDPVPFQNALTQAQAKLDSVRTDFANLKTNLASLTKLTDLAQQNVELKQKDLERKTSLLANRSGSQADVDTSAAAVVTAELQAQYAAQQKDTTLNQLLGDPNLPIEKFPAFLQAQAALDQAKRDLDHTTLRAPIAGTATQVDNIQLGRFIAAGTPVFSVIDDSAPWVDANPKETDITNLKIGQKAEVSVDTFPDHTFHGTVVAVSPGTGAQFSILPPQNATGNWVKVVQRVPVRIQLDKDDANRGLRSGMSVTVDIDTGHSRSIGSLLGFTSHAKEASQK